MRVHDMRETAHPRPTVEPLRSSEYARFKRVLNAASHPTFIGRETYGRNAREGGAFVFRLGGNDVAVALVKPRHGVLLALSVARAAQGRGVGRFALLFLVPNWVRAVESAVPFFERLGYVCVGAPKQGRRLVTRVMVRSELRSLAGRLQRLRTPQAETSAARAGRAGLRFVQDPREGAAPPRGVGRLDDADDPHRPDDCATRQRRQRRQQDAERGGQVDPLAVDPKAGVDHQSLAEQGRGRPPGAILELLDAEYDERGPGLA